MLHTRSAPISVREGVEKPTTTYGPTSLLLNSLIYVGFTASCKEDLIDKGHIIYTRIIFYMVEYKTCAFNPSALDLYCLSSSSVLTSSIFKT